MWRLFWRCSLRILASLLVVMELVVPWGEPPKVRGGEGYLRRTAEKVPVKRSKRSGKSLQGSSGVFKSGADPFLPLLRVAVATCESDAEPRTRISHIRAVKRKKLERHEYRQQPSTPSQIIHAGRRNREFPARLHAVAKKPAARSERCIEAASFCDQNDVLPYTPSKMAKTQVIRTKNGKK